MTKHILGKQWRYKATGIGGTYNSNDPTGAAVGGGTDLSQIAVYEPFSSQALGSDPQAIDGFYSITDDSVISAEQSLTGGQSFKNVSASVGTTGQAIGFNYKLNEGGILLYEGDEAWIRMPIYFDTPSKDDLIADPHLKFIRWKTQDTNNVNKNYSDIYHDSNAGAGHGIWKFTNEATGLWHTLGSHAPDSAFDFEVGKWLMWEMYIKFHSTAGEVRFYKEGVLVGEVTGIATLGDAAYRVHEVASVFTWNGGIPVEQSWYYDSVAMAFEISGGRSDKQHLSTDANGNKFIGMD